MCSDVVCLFTWVFEEQNGVFAVSPGAPSVSAFLWGGGLRQQVLWSLPFLGGGAFGVTDDVPWAHLSVARAVSESARLKISVLVLTHLESECWGLVQFLTPPPQRLGCWVLCL